MSKVKYRPIFNRKNEKMKPGQKALVQIEALLNRKRKIMSTGIYLERHQWNHRKAQVVKHEKEIQLNREIQKFISELEDFEFDMLNRKKTFTLGMLDSFRKHESIREGSFLKFLDEQLDSRTEVRKSTLKHHGSLMKKLKEFKKIKHFSDLTSENIDRFDKFLRNEGLKQVTIYSYHKRLKTYINLAIRYKMINATDNPYLNFNVGKGRSTEIRYLTPDELKRLEEKEFSTTRLTQVRDFFVFQCYTGVAYSDLRKLTHENYFKGPQGDMFLKLWRTKSDEKSTVMLLKKPLSLIEKYRDPHREELFPVMSNVKMNEYLKEIADLCGIEKKLTTHVARHTFATTVTLMNGVRLEAVSKMLGHASIKTTQVYSKIVDEMIAEEMKKLDN